jgi:hypothetical protein
MLGVLERVIGWKRGDDTLDPLQALGRPRQELLTVSDELLLTSQQEVGLDLSRFEEALGHRGNVGLELGALVGGLLEALLRARPGGGDDAEQKHATDAEQGDLGPQVDPGKANFRDPQLVAGKTKSHRGCPKSRHRCATSPQIRKIKYTGLSGRVSWRNPSSSMPLTKLYIC